MIWQEVLNNKIFSHQEIEIDNIKINGNKKIMQMVIINKKIINIDFTQNKTNILILIKLTSVLESNMKSRLKDNFKKL